MNQSLYFDTPYYVFEITKSYSSLVKDKYIVKEKNKSTGEVNEFSLNSWNTVTDILLAEIECDKKIFYNDISSN